MSSDKRFELLEVNESGEQTIGFPPGTTEFVVHDLNQEQFFFAIDFLHASPSVRGNGKAEITWHTSLEWTDALSRVFEWRKVVTVVNKSKDVQQLSFWIERLK